MHRVTPVLLALILCVAGLASAQSYSVDWFTVDGGGGTSSGGAFTINGTIGQPDAGVLSGGDYTVEGGFWSGISILQTTGAPLLSIQLLGTNAIISWPVGVSGFSLEETAVIGGVWSTTPQPVFDTATAHTVTVPATSNIKVYRLKK